MLGALMGASGGLSASSSATATSGDATGGTIGGDDRSFNFKSASGAGTTGGGVPSYAWIAAAAIAALWVLRRKS